MKKRTTNVLEDHRSTSSYFGRVKKDPDAFGCLFKENVDSNTQDRFEAFTPSPGRKELSIVNDTTAKTPNGTQLKKQFVFGPFVCFNSMTNVTPRKTKTDVAQKSQHADTIEKELAEVNPKDMKASFTFKDIEKIKAQKKRQGNRRKTTQGKVVSADSRIASATKIARKYKITNSTKQRFEWTHLIAYRFLGESGQVPENLVLATKECNSMMMVVEDAIINLFDRLSDDSVISLYVTADTIPGTHLGTCIHYRIVAEDLDFDLKVKFDPRMTAPPSKDLEGYVHRLFQLALEANKAICFDTPSPQKAKERKKPEDDINTSFEALNISF